MNIHFFYSSAYLLEECNLMIILIWRKRIDSDFDCTLCRDWFYNQFDFTIASHSEDADLFLFSVCCWKRIDWPFADKSDSENKSFRQWEITSDMLRFCERKQKKKKQTV